MKLKWHIVLLIILALHLTALACRPQPIAISSESQLANIHIQVELAGHCGNIPSVAAKHCAARPLSTQVMISDEAGQIVSQIKTDVNGEANIALAAGAYQFATPDSRFMSMATQTIRVSAGQQQAVTLTVHARVR